MTKEEFVGAGVSVHVNTSHTVHACAQATVWKTHSRPTVFSLFTTSFSCSASALQQAEPILTVRALNRASIRQAGLTERGQAPRGEMEDVGGRGGMCEAVEEEQWRGEEGEEQEIKERGNTLTHRRPMNLNCGLSGIQTQSSNGNYQRSLGGEIAG